MSATMPGAKLVYTITKTPTGDISYGQQLVLGNGINSLHVMAGNKSTATTSTPTQPIHKRKSITR